MEPVIQAPPRLEKRSSHWTRRPRAIVSGDMWSLFLDSNISSYPRPFQASHDVPRARTNTPTRACPVCKWAIREVRSSIGKLPGIAVTTAHHSGFLPTIARQIGGLWAPHARATAYHITQRRRTIPADLPGTLLHEAHVGRGATG